MSTKFRIIGFFVLFFLAGLVRPFSGNVSAQQEVVAEQEVEAVDGLCQTMHIVSSMGIDPDVFIEYFAHNVQVYSSLPSAQVIETWSSQDCVTIFTFNNANILNGLRADGDIALSSFAVTPQAVVPSDEQIQALDMVGVKVILASEAYGWMHESNRILSNQFMEAFGLTIRVNAEDAVSSINIGHPVYPTPHSNDGIGVQQSGLIYGSVLDKGSGEVIFSTFEGDPIVVEENGITVIADIDSLFPNYPASSYYPIITGSDSEHGPVFVCGVLSRDPNYCGQQVDLLIYMEANSELITSDQFATITVTVSNLGPGLGEGHVEIPNILVGEVLTSSQGTFDTTDGLIWDIPFEPNGATLVFTMSLTETSVITGTIEPTLYVDFDLSNNTSSVSITLFHELFLPVLMRPCVPVQFPPECRP